MIQVFSGKNASNVARALFWSGGFNTTNVVKIIECPEIRKTQSDQVRWTDEIVEDSDAYETWIVTESDVIFTALRVAVREGRLGVNDIRFHHCDSQTVENPQIDKKGRFDAWPPGFFDQLDKLLERLI